jgi:putative ATP-binding cassette transporter
LLLPTTLVVETGEALLIVGESGAGKSVLLRAIAGLWPWGSGRIHLPTGASLSYVPQRVFLPHGTLRDALHYPADDRAISDAALVAALERAGLATLAPRLQDAARWDHVFSAGERQRFALARLLAQRPDIILLDEAFGALDDDAQAELMALLRAELPAATIIAVAKRDTLAAAHDRVLKMHRGPDGARLGTAAIITHPARATLRG